MATAILCEFSGSITMVCRQRPPPPGIHCGRCSCSRSPFTGAQLSPASSDRNSAAGSTPQYTTSGSSARPGVICHTWASDRPEPSGKRTACRSGPVHVRPKSSLRRMVLPQWLLCEPTRVRLRPPRWSSATEYTVSPGKWGPSTFQRFREASDERMKAPLVVPTRTRTSPASWRGAEEDRGIGSLGKRAASTVRHPPARRNTASPPPSSQPHPGAIYRDARCHDAV